MSGKTVVVDYGIGNVFSVCNAIRQVGGSAELTGDLSQSRHADRVILPGVGAFARAMEALRQRGLDETLRAFVETGRPFLGICIGMQVLMDQSTEFGTYQGLGFIEGQVERIPDQTPDRSHLRVPHIGWATLKTDHHTGGGWETAPLSAMETTGAAVYFVHSYHCQTNDPAQRIAYTDYDGVAITAAIRRDNVVGVQFHPERSAAAGQSLLKAFLKS